jgi:hypothetical protein
MLQPSSQILVGRLMHFILLAAQISSGTVSQLVQPNFSDTMSTNMVTIRPIKHVLTTPS